MQRSTVMVFALLLGLPVAGSAQDMVQDQDARFRPPPGWNGRIHATLYRDRAFTGPAVSVQREESNLKLDWSVHSIRVQSGNWQICTGISFTGRCDIVSRDVALVADNYRRIRSIRPVYDVVPPVAPPPPGGGGGQSLRGMAAEFFPTPQRGGAALQCRKGGSAACAKETADGFCRGLGWSGSRNASLRTVGRRVHVVDVLCVRSGY